MASVEQQGGAMKTNIVVEGNEDRRIIEMMLQDVADSVDYSIFVARGKSPARPLARQLAILEHFPVVLVLDADTSDPERAASEQFELEEYFSFGEFANKPKVLLFLPEIESIFFDKRKVIERHLERPLSRLEIAAGKIAPKEALRALFSGGASSLVSKLTENDLADLRDQSIIASLRKILKSNSEKRK
jgi:hypothetical protein